MDQRLMRRLEWPQGKVDVVLDTDAYNEIDDQFAIAYMLMAGEKLNVQGIYAAPFDNAKSSGPADGMHKSYDEILHVLRLAGREDLIPSVFHGSERFLPNEAEPVDSDAARDLAERAMAYTPDRPLYVVAIGAITNIASALLMQPEITDRIVIVWLGGNAHHWPDDHEFNMLQDVASARVVFGCGAAVVQLPCMGVVSAFTTTGPELKHWLSGKSALCDYLVANTVDEAESYASGKSWSRAIWDVTAVGWLVGGDGRLMKDRLAPSPIPQYDHYRSFDPNRHSIRYVYHINRDALFMDLFERLTCDRAEHSEYT